tara:strand:+ start:271 stop:495 length:225 start_codon:yes stop_codon:yes gene_type:complete
MPDSKKRREKEIGKEKRKRWMNEKKLFSTLAVKAESVTIEIQMLLVVPPDTYLIQSSNCIAVETSPSSGCNSRC